MGARSRLAAEGLGYEVKIVLLKQVKSQIFNLTSGIFSGNIKLAVGYLLEPL